MKTLLYPTLIGLLFFGANSLTGQETDAKKSYLRTTLGFSEPVQTQGKGGLRLDLSGNFIGEYSTHSYREYAIRGGYNIVETKSTRTYTYANQGVAFGMLKWLDVYGGVAYGREYFKRERINFPNEDNGAYSRNDLNVYGVLRVRLTNQKGALPNVLVNADFHVDHQDRGTTLRTNALWHYQIGERWHMRGQFGYRHALDYSKVNRLMTNLNASFNLSSKVGVFTGSQILYLNLSNIHEFDRIDNQVGVYWNITDKWLLNGTYVHQINLRSKLGFPHFWGNQVQLQVALNL
jgi:hypothetical protein